MMVRFLTLSLTLIVFLGLISVASGQSFKCRYAKHSDEKLICSDPELGELDERMVATFKDLIRQAPSYLRRMLKAEQEGWLRSRHACKWNTRCVRGHYRARIRQLNAMFQDGTQDREKPDADDDYSGSNRYRRNSDDGDLPRRLQ